jgi:hypothetical protein
MKNDDFVLLGIFYDKHEFEQAREILEKAGIAFQASNLAPSVNFRVPGAAFTEIEVHVAKNNLEKAEQLLADLE